MQKVQVMMEVPKESKEVVDLMAALVKDLKAKKSLAEIASDLLPKLMVAVDGFSAIGEEVASDGKDEMAGYLVQQLMAELMAVAPVAAPAAPVV